MFYNKKTKVPQNEKLEVKITDFSKGLNFKEDENILKSNYSVNNYNFVYKKGVLTEGLGFETLKCPNYQNDNLTEIMFNPSLPQPINFTKIWFFKMFDSTNADQYNGGRIDKLIYCDDNFNIYYHRILTIGPMIYKVNPLTNLLEEKPVFNFNWKCNGVDYSIFGNEKNGVYVFDGKQYPKLIETCPKISSICEDKGKIFCTGFGEKNYIHYHTLNDFHFWEDKENDYNGKIYMNDDRGKINKVVSFLGYVFAIRDYGISKIAHNYNKNKFEITHLSLNGNRIYENTVRICGDKMLMLTKEGIMSFNGVTTKLLDLGINELLFGIENDYAEAVFHSGKYYLACKVNFNDDKTILSEAEEGSKNNAIIILDVDNLTYDIIRGVDVASIESIKLNRMDKVVMILNSLEHNKSIEFTDSGSFYLTPLKKEWVSPLTDLGYSDKIKFVRNVSLLTKYDCKITVFTDKDKKEYNVLGSNTLNKLKVDLKGKQIGLKIESNTAKAYISNIKLEIDLLDYGFTRY